MRTSFDGLKFFYKKLLVVLLHAEINLPLAEELHKPSLENSKNYTALFK